jgi:hypothetical protein
MPLGLYTGESEVCLRELSPEIPSFVIVGEGGFFGGVEGTKVQGDDGLELLTPSLLMNAPVSTAVRPADGVGPVLGLGGPAQVLSPIVQLISVDVVCDHAGRPLPEDGQMQVDVFPLESPEGIPVVVTPLRLDADGLSNVIINEGNIPLGQRNLYDHSVLLSDGQDYTPCR